MPNLFVTVSVDGTGSVLPNWTDVNASLGSAAIRPGSLRISWGGSEKINDSVSNTLAAHNVITRYSAGIVSFSPSNLPANGTPVTITFDALDLIDGDTNVSSQDGFVGDLLIEPGSLRFFADIDIRYFLDDFMGSGAVRCIENYYKTVRYNTLIVDVPLPANADTGTLWVGHNNSDVGLLKCYIDGNMYFVGYVDYKYGVIVISPQDFYFNDAVPDHATKSKLNGPSYLFELQTGNGLQVKLLSWKEITKLTSSLKIWIEGPTQTITGLKYSKATPISKTVTLAINNLGVSVPLDSGSTLQSVQFTVGNTLYTSQSDGTVTINTNPATGQGTAVGSVNASTGDVSITQWSDGASGVVAYFHAASSPATAVKATCNKITIRTASAPLRPGSFSVSWKSPSPADTSVEISHSATADLDGYINTPDVIGIVDYAHGIVRLWFVTDYVRTTGGDLSLSDFSSLGIPGVTNRKVWMAYTTTLKYNAVSYSYLPLDADLLGIDPVRLPSDGRVPIFRPGSFVVVGHKGEVTATVSNAQTIDCARVRLSRVRVIGNDGVVINTGYTADLEAGTVTFTDVSGYSQPVTVEHRIEDMMMTSDVQINGQLTFTRPLSHDYPLGSYVSSALIAGGNGDMFARVSVMFDQATWNGTFADAISGSAATGTFNSTQYPIVVTNRGARTERWAVQFTSGTTFNVIGENVGVIATGSVNSNCLPINPATNVPYFTIPALGWGAGWSAGNVLRFNTVGAEFPVWVVRTVQQGPETVPDDSFTLLIRGDVNTP